MQDIVREPSILIFTRCMNAHILYIDNIDSRSLILHYMNDRFVLFTIYGSHVTKPAIGIFMTQNLFFVCM